MNTSLLKSKIQTRFVGHGHFKTTIIFKGKTYSCISTNTMAIDKIGDEQKTPKLFFPTEKQALLSLWNECKLKNNLP